MKYKLDWLETHTVDGEMDMEAWKKYYTSTGAEMLDAAEDGGDWYQFTLELIFDADTLRDALLRVSAHLDANGMGDEVWGLYRENPDFSRFGCGRPCCQAWVNVATEEMALEDYPNPSEGWSRCNNCQHFVNHKPSGIHESLEGCPKCTDDNRSRGYGYLIAL